MSLDDNKTKARRIYDEVFNRGDLDVVDELVTPDIIDHEEPFPGVTGSGAEGLRQTVAILRTAFPDLTMTVEDMVAEGDKVVTRVTVRGTHQGEFLGMPPSGRQINVAVIDIVRFADGKMIEHWGQTDQMALLQQLGVIPTQ